MPLNTQSLDRILRTETTVSATITSNTAFTLPSAANMAGKLYTIYNPSASTANVLVNAADASLVVTVQPGSAAVVTPISDVPATNAAWMVVSNGVNASGLKGDTSGSAKAAGYVGEVLASTLGRASALTLSTGVAKTLTSIPVTAGTWLITGGVGIASGATTSLTDFVGAVSKTTNATSGASFQLAPSAGEVRVEFQAGTIGMASGSDICLTVPSYTYRVTSNTTLYLTVETVFTSSAPSAYGFIQAVRIA